MGKENVDDLVLMASNGDKYAYDSLYNWYYKHAITFASAIANQLGLYTFNKEEISFKISELFILTVQSYGAGKIPFEKYADFLLKKRITKIVVDASVDKTKCPISLDVQNEEGDALVDLIASNDYQYNLSNFREETKRLIMSSTNKRKLKIDKRLKKLIDLKEMGYKRDYIIKELKITDGQYRYLLRILSDLNKGTIEIK